MNRFLSALASVALCCVPAARAGDEAPSGLYSASLLQFINAYRSQHGLPTLDVARDLTRLANEHSRYMAAHGDISHDQFVDRFTRADSASCVENVGWNYPDARAQFDGWRQSPGHNAAMLDPAIHRGGIGVFQSYVTFFACS
jgi:uncharacterized protein YkwD